MTLAHATYVDRLRRRCNDEQLAACAGIDPSPEAVALLDAGPAARPDADRRTTTAAAMERFGGMVVEAVRDHVPAVKLQLAWFETAGAAGLRALERVVDYARRADLLVVLDGKRGDVPHSARAYADAWLGDAASSGIAGDALTVNGAIGADSVAAMAELAAARSTALYVLLHTSNPGASTLQAAELVDGRPWWHALASELATVDASVGGGVVGAVVGATADADAVLAQVRQLLPNAPLLVPGIGAQGGDAAALIHLSSDPVVPTLVASSRSLLPESPLPTAAFRFSVGAAAAAHTAALHQVDKPLTM